MGVWNGTVTVAVTVFPEPAAQPLAHVTVWVDDVERLAADRTVMAMASPEVLLNGDERAETRTASREASERTPIVSHSRLTSNVANISMKSMGMRMTNSTKEDPRSCHGRLRSRLTIQLTSRRGRG